MIVSVKYVIKLGACQLGVISLCFNSNSIVAILSFRTSDTHVCSAKQGLKKPSAACLRTTWLIFQMYSLYTPPHVRPRNQWKVHAIKVIDSSLLAGIAKKKDGVISTLQGSFLPNSRSQKPYDNAVNFGA